MRASSSKETCNASGMRSRWGRECCWRQTRDLCLRLMVAICWCFKTLSIRPKPDIDSSTILHYAAESGALLKTFSVSFPGRSFDLERTHLQASFGDWDQRLLNIRTTWECATVPD